MQNQLRLSSALIHHLLPALGLPEKSFDVPLMLGMRANLTIDPKLAHVKGDTIRVPVKATKIPDFTVTLSKVRVVDGVIWALPAIDGPAMAKRLPLADILQKALLKMGVPREKVLVQDKEIGIDPTAWIPLRLSHLEVDDGISADFESA